MENDFNELLCAKMQQEQDDFRNWLCEQTTEKLLEHAQEYIIREQILKAVKESGLTEVQAQVMWEQDSPLADVFHYYHKFEDSYMEDLRESVVAHANDLLKRQHQEAV